MVQRQRAAALLDGILGPRLEHLTEIIQKLPGDFPRDFLTGKPDRAMLGKGAGETPKTADSVRSAPCRVRSFEVSAGFRYRFVGQIR